MSSAKILFCLITIHVFIFHVISHLSPHLAEFTIKLPLASNAYSLLHNAVSAPLRSTYDFSGICCVPDESTFTIGICGLCALADDVLLAACGSYGLRALRLSSAQLCARDPSALKYEFVQSAALDAASGTLLLAFVAEAAAASGARDVMSLVSLQCVADEWRVWVGLSFADDSRVLYAFDVSAERRLRPVGAVVLDDMICRFACTRLGGDSLVAIADAGRTCVSAAAGGRWRRAAPRAVTFRI